MLRLYRTAVERVQVASTALGVSTDVSELSGVDRVATFFQVLALLATLVHVLLLLFGLLSGSTALSGAFVSGLAVDVLAMTALAVTLDFSVFLDAQLIIESPAELLGGTDNAYSRDAK